MDNLTVKNKLDRADITSRLYLIHNVAYLAAECPENKADTCLLQGAAASIGRLIQELIDDIEA